MAISAKFRIDQPGGGGPGTAGIAHLTLWRGIRVDLTPTEPPVGATYKWSMVRPKGSTALFLDPGGGDGTHHATPHFTPDVWGSYLIQCTINNGVFTYKLVAAVKYDIDGSLLKLGWRYPALEEGWLDASNPYGWKQAIEDIFDSLYGVISSLQMSGGYGGDDGADVRAVDQVALAEKRARTHDVQLLWTDGVWNYTILEQLDQHMFPGGGLQLVKYSRAPLVGAPQQGYGLALIDLAGEKIGHVLSLTDVLTASVGPFVAQSIVVYGTYLAIALDVGVAIIDINSFFFGLRSGSANTAFLSGLVLTNPDAATFGAESRLAFLTTDGVARVFITCKQTKKIYTKMVDLPLLMGPTGPSIAVDVADVAWTGSLAGDLPHGIALDDGGNLWVAMSGLRTGLAAWSGGRIVRFGVQTNLIAATITLKELMSYDDPIPEPGELSFDGAFIVVSHSYSNPFGPLVVDSDVLSVMASSGTDKRLVNLSVAIAGVATPLPVAYGFRHGSDKNVVWLNCTCQVALPAPASFAMPVPVRLVPSSGKVTAGWPIEELAQWFYDRFQAGPGTGLPVDSFALTNGPISPDYGGGILASFYVDASYNAGGIIYQQWQTQRALPIYRMLDTDSLAVRDLGISSGAIMAVEPPTTAGIAGTEPYGSGQVVPMVGQVDGDVPLWDTILNGWRVQAFPVGGFSAGQDLAGTAVSQEVVGIRTVPVDAVLPAADFDALLYLTGDGKYHAMQLTQDMIGPGFAITTFSTPAPLVEVLDTVTTPGFTAAYSQVPPYDFVHLDDTELTPQLVVPDPAVALNSTGTFLKAIPDDFVQFLLTAKKNGITKTSTCRITWTLRVFWGAAVKPVAYDEAFIEGLASAALMTTKNQTVTVDGEAPANNKHIYYCYRTAYGASRFWVGGFEGGFTLVAVAVPVTNPNGYVENYDVYESDNVGLGVTEFTVTN